MIGVRRVREEWRNFVASQLDQVLAEGQATVDGQLERRVLVWAYANLASGGSKEVNSSRTASHH